MGGSFWSLVCEASRSCASCGVADSDPSGPNTVACGIAGIDASGRDTVVCCSAGDDFSGADILAGGIGRDDCSGADTIDAGSCAGMDTWTVQADRQPRAVPPTMHAAINIRRHVPLIVSVSPEPLNGVKRHPCRSPFVSH